MKYIAFWEYKPEDIDKVIEIYSQIQKEREKIPRSLLSNSFHHMEWVESIRALLWSKPLQSKS